MKWQEFTTQEKSVISDMLFSCCSSEKWTALLLKQWPFASLHHLVENATAFWYEECDETDWLEAFSHHPKIGDLDSLKYKFKSTSNIAGQEQAGVKNATNKVLEELSRVNQDYEEKFGFIYIVYASGKTAEKMLSLAKSRLLNTRDAELLIAMGEQQKITINRLKKIFADADWSWLAKGQITTHVLDTSTGKPANGITIRLQSQKEKNWQTIAQGITDVDGRITDLLPMGRQLPAGDYKMIFETHAYFQEKNTNGFYPFVEVHFTIPDNAHYHIPLLLSPFGYSTYRGS